MDKNLPEYWVIKVDFNHPRWKEVEEYFNEATGQSDWFGGGWSWDYTGHDGTSTMNNGFDATHNIKGFREETQFITIDFLLDYISNTQPVEDPQPATSEFKMGDWVEVSCEGHYWEKVIFLYELDKEKVAMPIIAVCTGIDEEKYAKGEPVNISMWKYVRPVRTSLTVQELIDLAAKQLNISPELIYVK